jgi:hypothetical protein
VGGRGHAEALEGARQARHASQRRSVANKQLDGRRQLSEHGDHHPKISAPRIYR